MRVLNTKDFPALLPRLLKFEESSFGDYPYTPAPERLQLWWEKKAFFVAAVENEQTGELNSLMSILLTTPNELAKFCQGALNSSKEMQPHPGTPTLPAALYIPTLIVGSRYWTPVLFKNLLKDLDDVMQRNRLSAETCVATAADKRAIFLMKRFGFCEIGEYASGYKIMQATRESSALFRNMVR